MNQKQRVSAQIGHRQTDSVPYTLSFEGDVEDRLDAYYGSDRWRGLLDNGIRRVPVPQLVVDTTQPGPTVVDPYGSVWRIDRRPFHLEEPVLKEPSLAGYVFPSVGRYFDAAWRAEAVTTLDDLADHFVVAGFGFGVFERTWAMRGFVDALSDAASEPAFYDDLVERIAEHQLQIIDRLLKLPLDGIMFSDDWGYQRGVLLGPERWRRFIKPRLARMYARVHAAGKCTLSHCCGSVVEILPDIIEVGLDVLESVQPEAEGMNPYELKRRFGDHIAFWGGLGSQSMVPFGTPAEIRAEVRKLCREMGSGGGYILAPAKSLQPETPTANAAAVVESFLEQAGVRID